MATWYQLGAVHLHAVPGCLSLSQDDAHHALQVLPPLAMAHGLLGSPHKNHGSMVPPFCGQIDLMTLKKSLASVLQRRLHRCRCGGMAALVEVGAQGTVGSLVLRRMDGASGGYGKKSSSGKPPEQHRQRQEAEEDDDDDKGWWRQWVVAVVLVEDVLVGGGGGLPRRRPEALAAAKPNRPTLPLSVSPFPSRLCFLPLRRRCHYRSPCLCSPTRAAFPPPAPPLPLAFAVTTAVEVCPLPPPLVLLVLRRHSSLPPASPIAASTTTGEAVTHRLALNRAWAAVEFHLL
ncbi:hypothetical protein HU200_022590 [Digitaria exilis]|uniref:Uncharacterized protein n=1 Tax=Digitaria exilis TaxID=1010633 RepID=A0A835EXG0_9POAL|nr:hypothetical protein HU200_022590 [Digitaria exilis]